MHIPSSISVVASAFSAPTSGVVASIQIFRYSDFDSSGNSSTYVPLMVVR